MSVGKRLQELRDGAGLTLEQAGKIAGTTKQSTSQIEKGVTKVPGGLFLYNWSRHYGVNLEWLITGKGPVRQTSQPARLSKDTIAAAVHLATGASLKGGGGHFAIETEDDAEFFALAIDEVLDQNIEAVSDSDVERFALKFKSRKEKVDGKVGKAGSDGGADRSSRQAEAGGKDRVAAGRKRKAG